MVSLFVAQLPQLLPDHWAVDARDAPILAVVIDTLRFTSTACVALQAGAASVCVAAEVHDARRAAEDLGNQSLLCGERYCHCIEGFHLGNSPLEYVPAVVANRDLVFSTTNGTRAVAAAERAHQIVLASLLNRAAIVDWICTRGYPKVWILCAGTDGQIAAEDVLTAGAIVSLCLDRHTPCIIANDSARIALELFKSQRGEHGHVSEQKLSKLLMEAAGGKNLIDAGYAQDIATVAALDSIASVPRNSTEQPTRFSL